MEQLRSHLFWGCDVNALDDSGITPLAYATWESHHEVIRLLTGAGASVNSRLPRTNLSPLDLAIIHRDTGTAEILLAQGADVNDNGPGGLAPLHVACLIGRLPMLAEIPRSTPPASLMAHRQVPSDGALGLQQVEIASLLIDKGARLEAKTGDGDAALSLAIKTGQDKMVELLLIKGAVPETEDAEGMKPLHVAASLGKSNMVQILLSHGAAVDAKVSHGLTALHRAAIHGHEEIVGILACHGADINALSADGDTPLSNAILGNHPGLAQILLRKGATASQKALIWAVIKPRNDSSKWKEIALAMAWKADVDADATALVLGWASENGYKDLVEHILTKGVGDTAKNRALRIAASSGHQEIVRVLIARGAAVDSRDSSGRTALHEAVQLHRVEMVRVLVESGASISAEDDQGRTPVDYADVQEADVFLEHGVSMRDLPLHVRIKKGDIKGLERYGY